MIIITVPFALASLFLAAGLVPGAPLTADEQVIAQDCLARGASEAECACGVDAARDLMTEREVSLLAALVPALSSATDLETALLLAPQAAQDEGFTAGEFAAAMQKVFEHSTVVEQQCNDDGAADDGAVPQ